MTADECGAILIGNLARQRDYYNRLLEISLEQKSCILQGKEEQLPALLKDRDLIVRRLKTLDKVQKAYLRYWREHEASFPLRSAATVRNSFLEVEQQLQNLLCADDELKSLVQEKMLSLRGKIGQSRQSKRVVTAYGKPKLQSRPRFISKLCE